jgi:hypothetical protein
MIVFALKDNLRFSFSCVSVSEDDLEKKIVRAYWNWRGVQNKGSDLPLSVFLEDKTKVKITIDKIGD